MNNPLKLTPFYIFLDMDGVLNSHRSGIAFHNYTMKDLDPVACKMLDQLIFEFDSEFHLSTSIVISSTWRLLNDPSNHKWPLPYIKEWKKMFDEYDCFNLGAAIVGFTGSGFGGHRGKQIQEYREDNLLTEFGYVAIDDSWSDIEGMHPLIKCDESIGFSFDNYQQLRKMGQDIANEVKQSILSNRI